MGGFEGWLEYFTNMPIACWWAIQSLRAVGCMVEVIISFIALRLVFSGR